jgi:hypothetical protein
LSSPLTSLLNKQELTPLVKPGMNIRIEPLSQFGYYELPRSAVPEYLPPVEINLAVPWTTSLAAAQDSGQTSPISTKITQLEVPTLNLGHYRLYALDPLVRFEVYQPASTARFANKLGPISFHMGNTQYFLDLGMFSLLPEIFLYEDKTDPIIKAYNMDLDGSVFQARFAAVGFRYPLALKTMEVDANTGEPLEPIAVTIKVNERQ